MGKRTPLSEPILRGVLDEVRYRVQEWLTVDDVERVMVDNDPDYHTYAVCHMLNDIYDATRRLVYNIKYSQQLLSNREYDGIIVSHMQNIVINRAHEVMTEYNTRAGEDVFSTRHIPGSSFPYADIVLMWQATSVNTGKTMRSRVKESIRQIVHTDTVTPVDELPLATRVAYRRFTMTQQLRALRARVLDDEKARILFDNASHDAQSFWYTLAHVDDTIAYCHNTVQLPPDVDAALAVDAQLKHCSNILEYECGVANGE